MTDPTAGAAVPGADASRRERTLLLLAVFALAAVVYANALRNGYALDDEPIIRGNPVVHGLGDLRGVFLGPYWTDAGELYRPVTLFSFALGWAVHGGSPAAMHAVNVLLHALCSVLVAALVLRLRGGRVAALGAGALFAIHPVHVEAVANGVGRAEILCTLLVLLGCFAYLSPMRAPLRFAAVAALYLLALGAKENAVSFPALLLVVAAVERRGEAPRPAFMRLIWQNLPLMALLTIVLGIYLALRVHANGWLMANSPAPYLMGEPAARRVATAVRVWPEYARLLFWPADLSAEWGPGAISVVGWGSPRVWLGVLAGAAAAVALALSWRRQRWVAAAVAWVALALLPVSNLLFAIGVVLAERNLYLPSVGLAFLFPPLAAGVARLKPEARTWALGAAAVLGVMAAGRTWTRTPVWKTSDTVLFSMMDSHPELWWVEWHAGQLLARRGQLQEAIPWYRKALEKVGYNHEIMDLEFANVLRLTGRSDQAEPVLRHAIRTFDRSVPPYTLLAALLIDSGRYAEVPGLMDRAEAVPVFGPRSLPEINDRRAVAFDGLGRVDQALAARRANLRDPLYRRAFVPWYHYARLLALKGDTAGARMAVDSAKARTSPQIRAMLTLAPLPPLSSPLVRSWAPLDVPPPPAGPAAAGAATTTPAR